MLTLNSDLPERITLNKLVAQAVCFLGESFNNISVLCAPENPCTVVTDMRDTAPLHLGVQCKSLCYVCVCVCVCVDYFFMFFHGNDVILHVIQSYQ